MLIGDETRLYRGTRFQVDEVASKSLLTDCETLMRQHFHQVDAAVREAAGEKKMPLVVLGARHLQDTYRDVSTFPDLLLPTIIGGLVDLAPEAIHRCAWSIVEPELQAHEYAAADEHHAQQGTGRTVLSLNPGDHHAQCAGHGDRATESAHRQSTRAEDPAGARTRVPARAARGARRGVRRDHPAW
ncbi:hypothetical protein G7043_40005 [Lentzea sp. NEAU-D13]|uniref:Uncharacterized protein n=1 Tax=Lentzea alba TaxID=2714351 RepID=A0A7C9RWE2_9PSEU|nr:hypothetical protein [Lentzea alba]NGY65111.1 hypothetical protein [Lentzea alba]